MIKDSEAIRYVGRDVEVRGVVVSVTTSPLGTAFINFGREYPDQTFAGFSLAMAMAAQAQDDKSIFAGAHVGMTIGQCEAYYHRLHIGSMGHSGAPKGEVEVEFRTDGDPQRRVYVYYQKSNGKIVFRNLRERVTMRRFPKVRFSTSPASIREAV